MNIQAYRFGKMAEDFKISPQSQVRDCFQENSAVRNAYRCLPLRIGSELGWQIGCPTNFCCNWNGNTNSEGLKLFFQDEKYNDHNIGSHFGGGILTFKIPYIIRSPKKKSLYVRGPTNFYKEYCQYLDAVVGTDWLNFPFTYNIKINKKNTDIFFKKDEPICSFYFINLEETVNQNIQIKDIENNPALLSSFRLLELERQEKVKEAKKGNGTAILKKYYKGGFNLKDKKDDAAGCPFLHFKRLNLKCNNNFKLKDVLFYFKLKIYFLIETCKNTIINYFYNKIFLKLILKKKLNNKI